MYIYYLTSWFSGGLTSLLSVTRFITIRDVFRKIQKWQILTCIGTLFSFLLAITVTMCVFEMQQTVKYYVVFVERIPSNVLPFLKTGAFIQVIILSAGITTSLLTVSRLYKNRKAVKNDVSAIERKKSCVTILLMNIASSLWVVFFLARFVVKQIGGMSTTNDVMDFLMIGFVPLLTSTINPVIIILRSSSMRYSIVNTVSVKRKTMRGVQRQFTNRQFTNRQLGRPQFSKAASTVWILKHFKLEIWLF